jgi:arabinogalactan oligomer/maltooligosaccharide transport system permease protein
VTRPSSLRGRVLAGTALAAAIGAGLCSWLLGRALAAEARSREQRTAIVSLRALADVVEQAGGAGDDVRAAVAAFAKAAPELRSIRVVALQGLSLEASTHPADTGERTPPRRLAREEKPLYDQGQRLRAAVETNQQEGAARKTEIEVERHAGGGLSLAAPIEAGGAVTGVVLVETAPAPLAPASDLAAALIALVAPILLLASASALLGERRLVLNFTAAALVVAALAGYGRHALGALETQMRATESAVAERTASAAATAGGALAALQPAEARRELKPAGWDADVYRRPLGLRSDDGRLDERRFEAAYAAASQRVTRAAIAAGLAALAVLLFVGLGGASRLLATLRRHRVAYAHVAPAMVGMILLVFLPFLYAIVLSFTDQNIYNTDKALDEIWVGIRNYVEILGDFEVAERTPDGLVVDYQNFYWTLGFTVLWTVANVSIGVSVGLLLALVLNTRGLALRPLYRVLLILPWAVPNYITALIWRGMFHQQFGVANQVIQIFGGPPIAWFERTGTSFAAVLATNGWLSFPFMMVISLGALQSIPADLYEAARVDGASRWQQFRKITLPSLKPALVPAVVLSVIWTFNMFNIIYLVSAGEPAHSTEILITQAYKFAFEQYRYGYAAAYSTVIFGILLVYGTWQNRVTKATEGI